MGGHLIFEWRNRLIAFFFRADGNFKSNFFFSIHWLVGSSNLQYAHWREKSSFLEWALPTPESFSWCKKRGENKMQHQILKLYCSSYP